MNLGTMKGLKLPKNSVMAMYTDWIRKGHSYGAIGWYRIINPFKKLGGNIVGKYTFGGTTLEEAAMRAVKLREKGEIWWMRPSDATKIDRLTDTYRIFTGAKLVMDMDDDYRHINEDHLMKDVLREKEPIVSSHLRMADHVVVTTEPLKQSFSDLNRNITVIPNSIDPKIWDVKRKKRRDGKIRIGWTASASHYSDLPIIEPVMLEILKKYPNVEFHMLGMINETLVNDRSFHHQATAGYKEFPQSLADFDFDIAVAPIKDNQFNRCKSNIKWLEFSMLEIPMVLSKVYPYEHSVEHGKTGYLATSKDQWVKYLSWLIENPELRKKISKQAKQEVLDKWTIDKFLHLYVNIVENLMKKRDITVFTSITGGKDELIEPPKSDRAEYVAFSDAPTHSTDWKMRYAPDKFKSPVLNSKIPKMLGHKFTTNPFIIWIDGNIKFKLPPEKLVEFLGDADIAVFKHPGRDNIDTEQMACLQLGKGDSNEINEQMMDYSNPNSPDFVDVKNTGLCECGVIVRRNTPEVNAKFEQWFSEVARYSERDQLSFPKVFNLKKDIKLIPGSIGYLKDDERFPGNDFIKLLNHKK